MMKALGIDRLTVDERIALAMDIWDSVAAEVEKMPLTEAQQRELERRLVDAEAHPEDWIPWEVIQAETAARQKKLRGGQGGSDPPSHRD
jgi:putative addiction module component (TIGR02574 family)